MNARDHSTPGAPARRRSRHWLRLSVGFMALVAAALGAARLVPGSRLGPAAAEAAPPPGAPETVALPAGAESFSTLRESMGEGISVHFGMLSAGAAMGTGASDAEMFEGLEAPLQGFETSVQAASRLAKRNFSREERAFFDERIALLGAQTRQLRLVIRERRASALTDMLNQIDTTCQGCHARLAPSLALEPRN